MPPGGTPRTTPRPGFPAPAGVPYDATRQVPELSKQIHYHANHALF